VGEAEDGQASGHVRLIAQPVLGLRRGRAVISQAVGLDHKAELGPMEVNLEPIDPLFAQRLRQSRRPGDRPKEDLEVRIREQERMAVEQLPQRPHTRLACEQR
jgi:hypothetical protein